MVKKKIYIHTGLLLLSALIIFISGANDAAQSASQKAFYKGKVITFIVPYKTGGGYDTWSRMITPGIKAYTGANVVIKNIPGAGSLVGTNKVYVSDPNGLTIGILNTPGSMQSQLTGLRGAKFDLLKFTWLARLTAEQRVLCVGSKSKYRTVEAMRQSSHTFKFGVTGIGSPSFLDASLIGKAMKFKTQIITGYGGSREVDLAIIRGELDAMVGSYSSLYPVIKSKDLIPVVQHGNSKMPGLANVPNVYDVPGVAEKDKQLLDIVVAIFSSGRSVVAPPGLSPERAAFLRAAIKTSLEDPQFIKNAQKRKMAILYQPPKAIRGIVEKGLSISPDLKKRVMKIMGR
jgi:tripartite-type tricarboxylate transporter receptor subunit TctC